MSTQSVSEVIDQDRRQLLSNAAMGIAAAGAASIFPAFNRMRPQVPKFARSASIFRKRRWSICADV